MQCTVTTRCPHNTLFILNSNLHIFHQSLWTCHVSDSILFWGMREERRSAKISKCNTNQVGVTYGLKWLISRIIQLIKYYLSCSECNGNSKVEIGIRRSRIYPQVPLNWSQNCGGNEETAHQKLLLHNWKIKR